MSISNNGDSSLPFSSSARQVVERAGTEARNLDHDYIGTEHLLLGIVGDSDNRAAQILDDNIAGSIGMTGSETVRHSVLFILSHGNTHPGTGHLPPQLTPRAKRSLELAVENACLLQAAEIDSEHILLGLTAEGEGIAAGVLESMGLDHEKALGIVQKDQSA